MPVEPTRPADLPDVAFLSAYPRPYQHLWHWRSLTDLPVAAPGLIGQLRPAEYALSQRGGQGIVVAGLTDAERHRRAKEALRALAGADVGDTPEDWYRLRDKDRPFVDGDIPTQSGWRSSEGDIEVAPTTRDVPMGFLEMYNLLPYSCFASGTPVWTDRGPVAIDALRPADRVLTVDVDTAEMEYQPVIERTVRPRRPMVSLSLDDGAVAATATHLFWVFGHGWRPAGELRPGDLLRGAGQLVPVRSTAPVEPEYVHNLIVDGNANYFVGADGVLAHDFRAADDFGVTALGQDRYATAKP